MKYVPRGICGSRPTVRRPAASRSRLCSQRQPGLGHPLVALVQGPGHGGLERRAGDVGEELLDRVDRGDQLRRAEGPADLPAGGREGLAGRGDPHRPPAHAGKAGQRHVLGIVEDQVLVHLVTDHQHVVGDGQPGDLGQVGPVQHHPGRVVRGVDHQRLGPLAERRGQLVVVEPEVRSEQSDPDPYAPGQVDRGRVGVVERLERDHLVARVDERQERRRDGLGGPGGDQYLAVRVVAQPVVPAAVLGDRLPQRPDAAARRVLVDAAGDGRPGLVEHEVRAVGVREALAEVDRVGRDGQRRHLGEDRRRRRPHPVGLPPLAHAPTLVADGAAVAPEPGSRRRNHPRSQARAPARPIHARRHPGSSTASCRFAPSVGATGVPPLLRSISSAARAAGTMARVSGSFWISSAGGG